MVPYTVRWTLSKRVLLRTPKGVLGVLWTPGDPFRGPLETPLGVSGPSQRVPFRPLNRGLNTMLLPYFQCTFYPLFSVIFGPRNKTCHLTFFNQSIYHSYAMVLYPNGEGWVAHGEGWVALQVGLGRGYPLLYLEQGGIWIPPYPSLILTSPAQHRVYPTRCTGNRACQDLSSATCHLNTSVHRAARVYTSVQNIAESVISTIHNIAEITIVIWLCHRVRVYTYHTVHAKI